LFIKTIVPAGLKRDQEEREWRHKLDERLATAIETTQVQVQQLTLAVTVSNERLTTLTNLMVDHDRISAQNNRLLLTGDRRKLVDEETKPPPGHDPHHTK
jgi:hypothetical protein